ncbi:transposase [Streptosporangium sp. NPDC006007]|uniref:transposase n=1 Tax=Streptosporangium sp. NPDC006007 TaxID=3154575 RepID=UPI0033BB1044
MDARWLQTLAFITTGVTDARTEETNRLIKDAARVAFGFRRWERVMHRTRGDIMPTASV